METTIKQKIKAKLDAVIEKYLIVLLLLGVGIPAVLFFVEGMFKWVLLIVAIDILVCLAYDKIFKIK